MSVAGRLRHRDDGDGDGDGDDHRKQTRPAPADSSTTRAHGRESREHAARLSASCVRSACPSPPTNAIPTAFRASQPPITTTFTQRPGEKQAVADLTERQRAPADLAQRDHLGAHHRQRRIAVRRSGRGVDRPGADPLQPRHAADRRDLTCPDREEQEIWCFEAFGGEGHRGRSMMMALQQR